MSEANNDLPQALKGIKAEDERIHDLTKSNTGQPTSKYKTITISGPVYRVLWICLGLAFVVFGEIRMYYQLSPPPGGEQLQGFLAAKNPAHIQKIFAFQQNGNTYIGVYGKVYMDMYAPLYVPSSGPVYYFNDQGKLVEWMADAGVGTSKYHWKTGRKEIEILTAQQALERVKAKIQL